MIIDWNDNGIPNQLTWQGLGFVIDWTYKGQGADSAAIVGANHNYLIYPWIYIDWNNRGAGSSTPAVNRGYWNLYKYPQNIIDWENIGMGAAPTPATSAGCFIPLLGVG